LRREKRRVKVVGERKCREKSLPNPEKKHLHPPEGGFSRRGFFLKP